MKKNFLTPELENEIQLRIKQIDVEDKYMQDMTRSLGESDKTSLSVGAGGQVQVGTSIPRYFAINDTFVENPSNIGIGVMARMIETDPSVKASVQFKSLMMLSKVGEYQHEDEKIEEFVRGFIKGLRGPTFKQALEAMSSSYGYGFSVSEIIWGLNKQLQKVPMKIKTYHPSTICFEVDQYGEVTENGVIQFVLQFTQFANPNHYMPEIYGWEKRSQFETPRDRVLPYRLPFIQNYGLARIPRAKTILHTCDQMLSFSSPYGKSPVRAAHAAWQMKIFFMRQMGVGGKRQASPLIWATAPYNGNKVKVKKEDGRFEELNAVDALQGVLSDYQTSDAVVTGPESLGYKVEAIAAQMDLNQMLAVLQWLDVQIFRAFLLPSLVMTDGSAGSRSLGDKHFQIVDFIAGEEAATFTENIIDQMVRPAIEMNFGEQDDYGHFAQRPQSIDERVSLANMYSTLSTGGFIDPRNEQTNDYVTSTLHMPKNDESFYDVGMPNYDPIDGSEEGKGEDAEDEPEKGDKSKLAQLDHSVTIGDLVEITEPLREGKIKAGDKGKVVDDSGGHCAIRINGKTYIVQKSQVRKTH